MSYSLAFGDTEVWKGILPDADDVYVWRAQLSVEVTQPDDALRIVRAVGRARYGSARLVLNVRGLVVHDDRKTVDVVVTVPGAVMLYYPDSSITESVLSDDGVRARWPSLSIASPQFLRVTAPPNAIDFWRSSSPLWDANLGSGTGGPTAAFEQQQNLFVGKADEVTGLHPLVAVVPPPAPLPAPTQSGGGGVSTAAWVIGTVIVVWFASRRLFKAA